MPLDHEQSCADSLHLGGQAETCPEPSNHVSNTRHRQRRPPTDDACQVSHAAALEGRAASWLRDEEAARLTLLSYQAAKARRICCAAAKCSNQTDLHLTVIDPIRPAGLRQRPSLTSMPLATDQTVL